MGYLTAADGKTRISCDTEDAQHFRSIKITKINSHQWGSRKIGGSLARAIAKRFLRVRPTDVVVALRGPTCLQRKYLTVLPANATILHGTGVRQLRDRWQAVIYERYGVRWYASYPSRLAAVRGRNKALRELGYV